MKVFKLNFVFFWITLLLLSFSTARAQVLNDDNTFIMPVEGTGENITECSGTLKDPGGDEEYDNNTESIITIIPEKAINITLNFEMFEVEGSFDNLYIYDGPDRESPLIGAYSGTSFPKDCTITSSGGALTFMFDADRSTIYDGFELTWQCTKRNESIHQIPAEGEGERITACSGIIQDDGGDLVYNNNTNGSVTILPENASSIILDVYKVDFEEEDLLYIYDGPDTDSPLLTTLDETFNGGIITTSGGAVTLQQVTNAFLKNQGFELSWTCLSHDEEGAVINIPSRGTGENITACSGTLKDSGGDGNYNNETESTITIQPDNASVVTLNFEMFDIENAFDVLYIYDGPDRRSPLIGAYSGSSLPEGGSITSSGEAITLMFDTDRSFSEEGFELTWQCDIISSLNVLEKKSDLSISPNPATSRVLITYDGSAKNTTLFLYDETGEMVYQEDIQEGIDTPIDVSSFSAGVYTVQLVSDNQVDIKKLVIH